MHFILCFLFCSIIHLRIFQNGLGVGVLFSVSPPAWILRDHVFHFFFKLPRTHVNLSSTLFKKMLPYHMALLGVFCLLEVRTASAGAIEISYQENSSVSESQPNTWSISDGGKLS